MKMKCDFNYFKFPKGIINCILAYHLAYLKQHYSGYNSYKFLILQFSASDKNVAITVNI